MLARHKCCMDPPVAHAPAGACAMHEAPCQSRALRLHAWVCVLHLFILAFEGAGAPINRIHAGELPQRAVPALLQR
jgi:hypothetical protein